MTTVHLRMQGREVFRHAVVRMAEAIDAALEANGLTPGDVDWLVPHQANIRIIESMGRRRSEEHTSELQTLMRISYAVFCLTKQNNYKLYNNQHPMKNSKHKNHALI